MAPCLAQAQAAGVAHSHCQLLASLAVACARRVLVAVGHQRMTTVLGSSSRCHQAWPVHHALVNIGFACLLTPATACTTPLFPLLASPALLSACGTGHVATVPAWRHHCDEHRVGEGCQVLCPPVTPHQGTPRCSPAASQCVVCGHIRMLWCHFPHTHSTSHLCGGQHHHHHSLQSSSVLGCVSIAV